MTATDTLAVIQSYLEGHSPEFIAEDAVLIDHARGAAVRGPDAIGAMLYDWYHVAFPGAEAVVRNVSATDHGATLEFTFAGRNDGPLDGMPPTGRAVELPMCAVYEVSDGRIASIALYYDSATFARQLGLAPEPVG